MTGNLKTCPVCKITGSHTKNCPVFAALLEGFFAGQKTTGKIQNDDSLLEEHGDYRHYEDTKNN